MTCSQVTGKWHLNLTGHTLDIISFCIAPIHQLEAGTGDRRGVQNVGYALVYQT